MARSAAAATCARSFIGEHGQRPIEKVESERAVRGLVAHDAAEDRTRQLVAGCLPRAAQERNRQSLADTETASDHVGGAEQGSQLGIGIDDERIGIVDDLGTTSELHRHPRAQLDVDQLVHDEARSHRNEIERRAALVERDARWPRRRCRCGALETPRRSTACARERAPLRGCRSCRACPTASPRPRAASCDNAARCPLRRARARIARPS